MVSNLDRLVLVIRSTKYVKNVSFDFPNNNKHFLKVAVK